MAWRRTFRFTELKALRKSNWSRTWSGAACCNHMRTRCTRLSAPRGTPTPTCSGVRRPAASGWYRAMRSFPANRRRVSPTAMGRTPPPFFPNGIRRAPASAERHAGESRPQAKSLQTRANSCNRRRYAAVGRSHFRCWGIRPEKPPAEPGAKDRKASLTSSTVKSSPTGRSAGRQNGSEAAGWSACRAAWTSSGTGKLFWERIRAAFESAPSRTARRAARRTAGGMTSGSSACRWLCDRERCSRARDKYSRTSEPCWPDAHRAIRPFTTATTCLQCRRPPLPTG